MAPGEDPDEALARRLKAEFGNTLAGPDGFTPIPEQDQVCKAPENKALVKTDGKIIDKTDEWKAEHRAAAKQRAKDTLDRIQGSPVPQPVTKNNIASQQFADELSHYEKGSEEYKRLMASIDTGISPAPIVTEQTDPQGACPAPVYKYEGETGLAVVPTVEQPQSQAPQVDLSLVEAIVQKDAEDKATQKAEDKARQKWEREQSFQGEMKGYAEAGEKQRKKEEQGKIQTTLLSDKTDLEVSSGVVDHSKPLREEVLKKRWVEAYERLKAAFRKSQEERTLYASDGEPESDLPVDEEEIVVNDLVGSKKV